MTEPLTLAQRLREAADEMRAEDQNGWPVACDLAADELDRISAELAEARKELEWYGENARLARLIHSEGDAGRHALQADGGKRARSFLASKEASHDLG